MAFLWFLVFWLPLSVAVAPQLAYNEPIVAENKLEIKNQSGIHLKIFHVHGPESFLNPDFLSFSDFMLLDEERVKGLTSMVLAKTIGRRSIGNSLRIPLNPGLSIGSGNYYVRIGLGTPAKSYATIMDTGSSFSWIQCQPCKVYCYNQVDPVFDPSASKTYKSLSCSTPECSSLREATLNNPACISGSNKCVYMASYGDSSYSIGYLSRDLLSLAKSQSFPGFIYGCGQDNEGLFGRSAGILGLARAKLSMIAQVSSKYGYAFSYCLPTATASAAAGGFLTIGTRSLSAYKFTPMVTDPRQNPTPSLYYLKLTSMAVGGSPLRVAAAEYRVPTIIDSGTVITRLPMALYSALRDAFVSIMSKNHAQAPPFSILDACFHGTVESITMVPPVKLVFQGGADLDLGARNVLLQVDKGVICLAFARSNQVAIIGNHQQQTFEVAYDVANSRIGFAANACH